ncbi:MAG: hypothetical protein GY696_08210 [Gammaproteobacteria bacterium]|nr:hypothetical protein [Gammaproteobacteria bacterium]
MEELLMPPGGGLNIGSPSPRVKVNQGPAWFTFTFLHPGVSFIKFRFHIQIYSKLQMRSALIGQISARSLR